MEWKKVYFALDAADQLVQVGDRVVYTVGDRSSRRLKFGVIEEIKEKGPFLRKWKPKGTDTWEEYEHYEYKYNIRHSPPDNKSYFSVTGVSPIEGKERILALPQGMYVWVFTDIES